jgi:mono/diheme cytochrome c family protein
MKKIHFILIFVVGALVVTSCGKDYRRNPGKIYAPDMTYSRAYDYYNGTDSVLNIGLEKGTVRFNKMPVKNTIAREQGLPTHISEEDTTAAKALTNPYTLYAKDMEQGERLYLIHCGICHGEKLDGQGPLYTSDKYAAAPANLIGGKYLNFSAGKIYHAIMYGKNMMGAYSSQLDSKNVQAEKGGAAFNMISEESAEEVAMAEEDHHDDESHGTNHSDEDHDHENHDGEDHAGDHE